jgi:hypothetical protein
MNHKQMWNRYTENRSKQPPPTGPVRIAQPTPTGPVRIAQPPPTGPVRIAQTPQGQFIHCLGQKTYSNIPMIPRTATPLPPVQTMIPPGNQLSSTSCLRIVRPVQQQLHPVNQQLRPTQQQPCHRQTFLPKNLLNGLLIYLYVIYLLMMVMNYYYYEATFTILLNLLKVSFVNVLRDKAVQILCVNALRDKSVKGIICKCSA